MAIDAGGCGVPVIVDLGAFEQTAPPATVILADVTGDGAVDIQDLLAVLSDWGTANCLTDFDLSTSVGAPDLFRLLDAWSSF